MTSSQPKQYTLLSPIKVIKLKSGPFQAAFEITKQEIYTIQEHGIQIKKPINTFFKSTPISKYQAAIPNITPLSKEVAEAYLNFQSIISHCIINGESINTQLRDLLILFKELNYKKEEILKMDFMKLRDVFSEFIDKHHSLHNEPNLNTKKQRKDLTKLMFQFITDRNIYTHGTLRIQRPKEAFVIDYIENKKDKIRVNVTLEILDSYLSISELLRQFLSQTSHFYRNL